MKVVFGGVRGLTESLSHLRPEGLLAEMHGETSSTLPPDWQEPRTSLERTYQAQHIRTVGFLFLSRRTVD